MSRPSRSTARRRDAVVSADRLGVTLPDGRPLFDGLTLGFGDERTGLVGANGSGKSTLLRLLVGAQAPSTGTVVRRGRIGYLPQHRAAPDATATVGDALDVGAELAALERIMAERPLPADLDVVGDRWDLRERVGAELARLGLGHLALGRPLGAVSGGEATRLALAAVLLDGPDLLVLDEPTNDLDAASREALYAAIDAWRGGVLVVTHDRALLGRVDRIVELSAQGARIYGGNYAVYDEQRTAEALAASAALAHARKELRKTERDVQRARERQDRRARNGAERAVDANMPRVALGIMQRRSEATTGRLRDVGARLAEDARAEVTAARRQVEVRETMAIVPPSAGLRANAPVVALERVRYTHPGASTPIIVDVSLALRGPERVAITGPNGSGKTTLLRLLTGELTPDAGVVRWGVPRAAIAYLDQRASALDPAGTVVGSFAAAHPTLDAEQVRHALARSLFRGEAAEARVATLSGGERLRAALAIALHGATPPQLLVLDEPTNHLDLESLRALETTLAAYDGALVVVSHDAAFLDALGVTRWIACGRR